MSRRLALAGVVLITAIAVPAASAEPGYDRFQSPTGNIRCEYRNQVGVGCMTLSNGVGVFLRSFGSAYYINRPYSFQPARGWTLAYGRTWRISSFRCYSSTSGMKCSSTVTGHGFFISRDTRYTF